MRLRIWLIIAAIPLVYVIVLGAHIAVAAVHARSYFSSLGGEYNRAVLSQKSSDLASDINHVFTDLSVPGVKQIAGALGVDFTPIREEAVALIKESSWLAGADAPKSYLIAFQNSAEARGTGGIMGAYSVVRFNHGHIQVVQTGSNAKLQSQSTLPIAMPTEYLHLYGNNAAIWQNSNISPQFEYAGQIYSALWQKQFNQKLDGVFAVDPEGIAKVLAATGPIILPSGEKIEASNVVEKTLSTAYKTYAKDNHARKEYLVSIMRATIAKLQSGHYSLLGLAQAVRDDIIENRLLIYSADPEIEAALSQSRLGGNLTYNAQNQFRAVIINTDASKLDYYLKRKVTIKSVSCSIPRHTQIAVTLTNTVTNAAQLPAYVLTRADKGKPANLITGQHRFKLFIYGPILSKLTSASRTSTSQSAGGSAMEKNRPVLVSDVDLAPGASETILANFVGGTGPLAYFDQPLVLKTSLSIENKC
jgi:Protein of unknown function (DUF4012)